MTEELNLPPEVRAVQAAALRDLESHWPCDARDCELPGAFGCRTTCCQVPVLLCTLHFCGTLRALADAKINEAAVRCPRCNEVKFQPVAPGHVYDFWCHLIIAGPALGGAM